MKSRIYLDHAATTPVLAPAIAAMADAAALVGNPASVHSGGRNAFGLLEGCRDQVAAWAGVPPANVVFTSGGTEALALALNGSGWGRVLAGATEHSAVLQARRVELLPVDAHGLIDLDALAAALQAGPALVAAQQANNETGVVQPIGQIAEIVSRAGGALLVDAVQAAGKLPLPQADFVAISGHKLGGPPGVGALIVREPGKLGAVQKGGGQERGLRGGTPNLPGIAGLAAALAVPHDWAAVADRRARLEAAVLGAGAVIHGAGAPRMPHISSIGLAGVPAATQVMM
ncbi:MAG: aminotransferase class V-fold PLP-dependent enzyme, partial [Sphingomonadales bacterium]